MSYAAPYAGLKVIDVSQGVAGPYCAMMLAQYGANVIKVEPTDTGDWARGLGTKVRRPHRVFNSVEYRQTLDRAGSETTIRPRRACGA